MSRKFSTCYKPILRQLVSDVNVKYKPFADKIAFCKRHPDICVIVDASKRYAGYSGLYSFRAVKYLTNLETQHLLGLKCYNGR